MAKTEHFNATGLIVGENDSRPDIAELCGGEPPINTREWVGIREYDNCVLLFVTLDKKDFDNNIQYDDIFDDTGQTFFWESQNRNTQETYVIQRIINQDPVLLFVRLVNKVKSKTLPFVYVGHVTAEDYESEMPVHMSFNVDDWQQQSNEDLQELYIWEPNRKRRKRDIEVSPKRKQRSKAKKQRRQSSGGQGRASDAARNKAVEMRAMGVATEYYRSQGFTVADTSANKPYDLECTKGGEIRRVEVKGTTQGPRSVNVTVNEVVSARANDCETDLFIVHGISVSGTKPNYQADQGEPLLIENWKPDDASLTPTMFVYHLPTEFLT
jgi:hypothetical protein